MVRDCVPGPYLTGGLLVVPHFLPGPAAPDAGGPFGHRVRTGPRVVVAGLDQDPAPLASAGQREAPGQLAAVQNERDMSRLLPQDMISRTPW